MAFIGAIAHGQTYAPGWFLKNNEDCTRLTYEIDDTNAVSAGGGKYVPMGTLYEDENGNPIGFVYEDVDVTDGNMPGSVVTKGDIYEDRLPAELDDSDKTALIALGFTFVDTPTVVRPDFSGDTPDPPEPEPELEELTVTSVEGTASGDTKITVTGYEVKDTEGYVYKVGDAAEEVEYGDDLSTWTDWNGTADITAATGKVITVAVVDASDKAVAAGHATVVAKT